MTNSRPLDPEALLAEAAWVRALARSLVRGDEVDDLVQDTWTAALERRPDVDTAGGMRAWLGRVTRNLAIDRRRGGAARAWHAERSERREPERPDEAVARVALQQKLVAAVLALDEPYRSAVIWRYLDALDANEIAKRQSVTPEAARKRISRGLATLRERFDREHRGGRAEWLALFACVAEPPQVFVRSFLVWKLVAALLVASLAGGVWWASASSPSTATTSSATPNLVSAPVPLAVAPTPDPNSRVAAGSALAASSAPSAQTTLRGRVLDADGAPKAGARVDAFTSEFAGFTLLDKDAQSAREHVATRLTNDQGEFAIPAELDRVYDLEAGAGGVRAAPRFDVSVGMDVTLELRPMGSLYGRVVRSESAEPLVGVRVEACCMPERHSHSRAIAVARTTDEEGIFRFESLPPGDYEVRAVPTNAPSVGEVVTVQTNEASARNLLVPAGRTVRGRVVDAASDAPIAGATVGGGWEFDVSTVSDAQGEFEVDGFSSASDAWLRVRAQGYGMRTIGMSKAVEPLVIRLEPASTWRGRVVDAHGNPLADAYVCAMAIEVLEADRGSGVQQSDRVSDRTDAGGAFELVDVRNDVTHALFVRDRGFGALWIAVPKEPKTDRNLPDIVLEPGATIRGVVVDEHGAPVSGAAITLAPKSVDGGLALASLTARYRIRSSRSDGEGRFRFGDVACGTYQLSAATGEPSPNVAHDLVVTAPGATVDVELELERGLSISGSVHDGAGRALFASVSIQELASPRRAFQVFTDGAGAFRADGLVVGNYRVTFVPQALSAVGKPVHPTLTLEDVAAGSAPLNVTLPPGVLVRGRVLDADGLPIVSSEVRVDGEGRIFGRGLDWANTDAAGAFELVLAPSESVSILANWPAHFAQPPYASGLRRVDVETPVPSPEELEIRFAWRLADGAPDAGGK